MNELSLRQSPVYPSAVGGVQWGGETQGLLANWCCQPLPGGIRGAFWGQGVKPITCLSIEVPQAPSILLTLLPTKMLFEAKASCRLFCWVSQSVMSEHLLCAKHWVRLILEGHCPPSTCFHCIASVPTLDTTQWKKQKSLVRPEPSCT